MSKLQHMLRVIAIIKVISGITAVELSSTSMRTFPVANKSTEGEKHGEKLFPGIIRGLVHCGAEVLGKNCEICNSSCGIQDWSVSQRNVTNTQGKQYRKNKKANTGHKVAGRGRGKTKRCGRKKSRRGGGGGGGGCSGGGGGGGGAGGGGGGGGCGGGGGGGGGVTGGGGGGGGGTGGGGGGGGGTGGGGGGGGGTGGGGGGGGGTGGGGGGGGGTGGGGGGGGGTGGGGGGGGGVGGGGGGGGGGAVSEGGAVGSLRRYSSKGEDNDRIEGGYESVWDEIEHKKRANYLKKHTTEENIWGKGSSTSIDHLNDNASEDYEGPTGNVFEGLNANQLNGLLTNLGIGSKSSRSIGNQWKRNGNGWLDDLKGGKVDRHSERVGGFLNNINDDNFRKEGQAGITNSSLADSMLRKLHEIAKSHSSNKRRKGLIKKGVVIGDR